MQEHSYIRIAPVCLVICLTVGSTSCEREEEEIRPPEIAEMDREGGGVVEWERALPLDAEDVGDTMTVAGQVVGNLGQNGFFVRAESNNVIFVQTPDQVTVGDRIRVTGPLQVTTESLFAGWERDLLSAPDPVWIVTRLYYVQADSVQKY